MMKYLWNFQGLEHHCPNTHRNTTSCTIPTLRPMHFDWSNPRDPTCCWLDSGSNSAPRKVPYLLTDPGWTALRRERPTTSDKPGHFLSHSAVLCIRSRFWSTDTRATPAQMPTQRLNTNLKLPWGTILWYTFRHSYRVCRWQQIKPD